MIFLSPLWLIGLFPWAAVTLYLLWGRRRQEGVPFLDLWMGPVKGPRPRRRVATPPLALALAILAMLLAVLGAAGPALTAGRGGFTVTLIVDRGSTMSAWGEQAPRFVETRDAVRAELDRLAPGARVSLRQVPAGEQPSRTSLDTRDAVRQAVRRALAETPGPVVAVSDHPLETQDERLVQAAPDRPLRNAGIVLLAARQLPAAQVMVRVRTTGGGVKATLNVMSTSVEVELASDGVRDHFIDLPSLPDVIAAQMMVQDDYEADDVAWLIREGSPPRIEPRVELPPALRRMVDVYTKARPAADDAPRVPIANDVAALGQSQGAALAAGTEAREGRVRTLPHPVTAHVTFESLGPARLASLPQGNWTPVLTIADAPAVAVREQPARQVWIGLDAPDWSRQPGYVVFWTNVFDWLAGGTPGDWQSHPPGSLGPTWKPIELAPSRQNHPIDPRLWPGIYERTDDAARRAINAPPLPPPSPPPPGWRARLPKVLSAARHDTATPLAPWLLTASLACLAGAAMSWRRRILTQFSAGRSVPD